MINWTNPVYDKNYKEVENVFYFNFADMMNVCREIGITYLTGEACALSMRMLVEVTPAALELIAEFFGLPIQKTDRMFLTHDMVKELVIFWFAKQYGYVLVAENLNNHQTYLYLADKNLTFHNFYQEHREKFGYCDDQGNWIKGTTWKMGRSYVSDYGQPRRGMSNVSAWTGVSQQGHVKEN